MDCLVLVSSIEHKEKLHIAYKDRTYFGANQSWFSDKTQVFGGCGPICGFNLLTYYGFLDIVGPTNGAIGFRLKQMYEFIKPTELTKIIPKFLLDKKFFPPTLGIRSLYLFKKRFVQFANQYLASRQLKIHEFKFKKNRKNQISSSLEFITSALNANQPLCFLNTFHKSKFFLYHDLPTENSEYIRDVDELNTQPSVSFMTHWVLVTGLYKSENTKEYYLECSTWGKVAYFKLSDFYENLSWKTLIFPSGMLRIEL